MILAAGLGTRLDPITRHIPKPLVPVAGIPNIVRIVERLKKSGIAEVVINTHWLPDVLKAYLGDGSAWGVCLAYSDETEILGTGGGIRRALSLLGDDTFVVINGDALFAPDIEAAVTFHEARRALATLVVRADPAAERYGAVGVDDTGRIGRLVYGGEDGPHLRHYMFTGVHIISKEAARQLPERGCIVQETYIPLVEAGAPIYALPMGGYFCDLGTPERYLSANVELLTGRARLDGLKPPENGVVIADTARVDRAATLGPGTAVSGRAQVLGAVHLERTVVLDGATVTADVTDAIVTPRSEIVSVSAS